MLRLTRTNQNATGVVLKAEGQIVAEWVSLLEEECLQLLSSDQPVLLDMSNVSYLDRGAVRMLRNLSGGQLSIINCSPLVEELLAEEAI
jgi:anti-anti-sigma regulatory factor